MSDVEESNAEDNDDLESVPSPPPKELTKEDITGKLDDNSDPTVVIERYQNTAENEARKKDFIKARNHFIATEVRGGNNSFLNPAKRPGAASRFGDGDGSYWDRWIGPMPLPTKGSFSAGHIKPKHGTKSDRDKYFAALKRMEIDKEMKMARSLERLSRQKLDDDTGFNDMNVEKEATIIKLKEDVKNEFFQDVVDRMKQEDKTAPNYGYLPPVEVNHHDMDSIKALNKFEDVELDDGTEEFLDLHPDLKYVHSSMFHADHDRIHKHYKRKIKYVHTVPKIKKSPRYYLTHETRLEKHHYEDELQARADNEEFQYVDSVIGKLPKPKPLPERLFMKSSRNPTSIVLPHYGLGDVRARKVGNCLKVMKKVVEINVENNRLNAQSLVTLFSNIKPGQGLEKIYAGKNKVNHHTIKALALKLQKLNTLTVLHLQGTDIRCRQAKLICHTLKSNNSITDLNLSGNKIEQKGGISIGEMLEENTSLRMLDISWNYIRDDGAVAIGKAIGKNDTLKWLNLGYNAFYEIGTEFLADSLETNKCLEYLDLTANKINSRPTIVLANGLDDNENLLDLILDENPLGLNGTRSMLRLYGNGEEDTKLSMKNINMEVNDGNSFDPNELQRSYEFVLTNNPYEQAVLCDIIRKANRHGGVSLINVQYSPEVGIHTKPLEVYRKVLSTEEKETSIGQLQVNGEDWSGYEEGVITFDVDYIPCRPSLGNALKPRALDNLLEVILNEAASDREKMVMIELTCCDMFFTCEQLIRIQTAIPTKKMDLKVGAVIELIQRVVDPENLHFFYTDLDNKILKEVKAVIGQLYYFIADNPGDHYQLDLGKKYDRVILEKLLEINELDIVYSKEIEVCKRRDISQYGDYQNFRNVVYNEVPIIPPQRPLAKLFQKEIPTRGLLVFDYTQPRKQTTDKKTKTCSHKQYQRILRDLGILSDEEWAAFKIGRIIRGKIGRRRALQIAEQKRKLDTEGEEKNVDVKKIVKLIHCIYDCAREYWNIIEDEHGEELKEGGGLFEKRFQVSMHDVIDDYIDEAEEEGSENVLEKAVLMEHVNLYQEANSFIRWFGTLASALSSYIHEGMTTFTSQEAFAFLIQIYNKLMGDNEISIDDLDTSDGVMVDANKAIEYMERVFNDVCDEHEELLSHLDDCSEYLQGLSKAGDGKLPLDETLDRFMRLYYYMQPENQDNSDDEEEEEHDEENKMEDGEPEVSNDAEKTLTDYVKLSKRVSMTEEEKQRQKEIEGIKEKLLYPFHETISYSYITCSQLILTVKLFPSTYPELRVQVMQKLFGRLADLERFHTVLEEFETDVEEAAIKALGWLAVFNPSFPDRYFNLNLGMYEDRQMAQMLVYLAIKEDGENWQDEQYWRWNIREARVDDESFAGWELPLGWTEENEDPSQTTKGIPFKGRIALQYYSGADKGCAPNWEARAALQERCLVGDLGWKRVQKFDNSGMVFKQLSQ